jgi:hypothetical protein
MTAGSLLPQKIEDLSHTVLETDQMRQIPAAVAALIRYDALAADFIELRQPPFSLAAFPAELGSPDIHNATAETWLLCQAALVSQSQVEQHCVNSPITVAGESVTAYRPPMHGRACLVPVRAASLQIGAGSNASAFPGLLSLKGCGVAPGLEPAFGPHCDGLLPLHMALLEYLHQCIIEAILIHAGSCYGVVRTYAVIDTGFDVISSDGQHEPAGLLVRQAHHRPVESDLPTYGSAEQRAQLEIEMILRCYGFSSCADLFLVIDEQDDSYVVRLWTDHVYATYKKDVFLPFLQRLNLDVPFWANRLNVQTTCPRDHTNDPRRVVDFAHYRAHKAFKLPVVSSVCDRPFTWGGLLMPSSPHYVQPFAQLLPPDSFWGDIDLPEGFQVPPTLRPLVCNGKLPRPHVLTTRLARDFRAGLITSFELRRILDRIVSATVSGWGPAADSRSQL